MRLFVFTGEWQLHHFHRIVAILNPQVLAPMGGKGSAGNATQAAVYHTARVSAGLQIVKVGQFPELSFCKGVKKTDGQRCGLPIDKAKCSSGFCTMHAACSGSRVNGGGGSIGGGKQGLVRGGAIAQNAYARQSAFGNDEGVSIGRIFVSEAPRRNAGTAAGKAKTNNAATLAEEKKGKASAKANAAAAAPTLEQQLENRSLWERRRTTNRDKATLDKKLAKNPILAKAAAAAKQETRVRAEQRQAETRAKLLNVVGPSSAEWTTPAGMRRAEQAEAQAWKREVEVGAERKAAEARAAAPARAVKDRVGPAVTSSSGSKNPSSRGGPGLGVQQKTSTSSAGTRTKKDDWLPPMLQPLGQLKRSVAEKREEPPSSSIAGDGGATRARATEPSGVNNAKSNSAAPSSSFGRSKPPPKAPTPFAPQSRLTHQPPRPPPVQPPAPPARSAAPPIITEFSAPIRTEFLSAPIKQEAPPPSRSNTAAPSRPPPSSSATAMPAPGGPGPRVPKNTLSESELAQLREHFVDIDPNNPFAAKREADLYIAQVNPKRPRHNLAEEHIETLVATGGVGATSHGWGPGAGAHGDSALNNLLSDKVTKSVLQSNFGQQFAEQLADVDIDAAKKRKGMFDKVLEREENEKVLKSLVELEQRDELAQQKAEIRFKLVNCLYCRGCLEMFEGSWERRKRCEEMGHEVVERADVKKERVECAQCRVGLVEVVWSTVAVIRGGLRIWRNTGPLLVGITKMYDIWFWIGAKMIPVP